MNMQKNILPDPELVLQEMIESSEIDRGIMIDALFSTPKYQEDFDKNERGKPPVDE